MLVDVRYYIFLIDLQTFLSYISVFCLNDFNNVNSTSEQCFQIVDPSPFTIFSNKNQFVKHNLDKFWNYYFFKYFLHITDAKFGKEY